MQGRRYLVVSYIVILLLHICSVRYTDKQQWMLFLEKEVTYFLLATRKFRPTRLELWLIVQLNSKLYSTVCGYLQSEDSLRAFSSLSQTEGYQQRLTSITSLKLLLGKYQDTADLSTICASLWIIESQETVE